MCWKMKMATRKGLEPSTSAVTGRHSNRLNYRAIFMFRTNHTVAVMVGGTGIEPVTLAL